MKKTNLKKLISNQEKEDNKEHMGEENCTDYCCTCGDNQELIEKYVVNQTIPDTFVHWSEIDKIKK